MSNHYESSLLKEMDTMSFDHTSTHFLLESGLPAELVEKLYDYQKFGVEWLIKKFSTNQGGAILADDMGLGKTVQVLCFLNCLYKKHKIRTILLILPKSLIDNWKDEIRIWFPQIDCAVYEGSKKQRQLKLTNIQSYSGILITTYGMVCSSWELLGSSIYDPYTPFKWDCIILDESHKIRNPTKTARNIYKLEAEFRLAMTGTPLQNNMLEMFNLINFVANKFNLFGNKKTFESEFATVITQGRLKDISDNKKKIAHDKLIDLQKIIKPYILRRTKTESNIELTLKNNSQHNIIKIDLIVWLTMTNYQVEVYKKFLESDAVVEALKNLKRGKSVALVKLNILRQIPNHPYLSKNFEFMTDILNDALSTLNFSRENNVDKIEEVLEDIANFNQFSCKINITLKILKELFSSHESNHKVIIFSQSRKLLDMLAKIINSQSHIRLLQLDGRTNSTCSRQEIINKFQNDADYKILLATIQVGGLGLNLTAADRVIILEPSWNPGNEYQAIDRAYRIGQQNNVVVYRLVTCGTVEEKMYRKQIFKEGVTKNVVENQKDPFRYFSWFELTELFLFGDPHYSLTHAELSRLHTVSPKDPFYEREKLLLTKCGAYGVTNNGLLYEHINKNINIFNEINEANIVAPYKNTSESNIAAYKNTNEANIANSYKNTNEANIANSYKNTSETYGNIDNDDLEMFSDIDNVILSSTRLSISSTPDISCNLSMMQNNVMNSTRCDSSHPSNSNNDRGIKQDFEVNKIMSNPSSEGDVIMRRRKNRFLEDSSGKSSDESNEDQSSQQSKKEFIQKSVSQHIDPHVASNHSCELSNNNCPALNHPSIIRDSFSMNQSSSIDQYINKQPIEDYSVINQSSMNDQSLDGKSSKNCKNDIFSIKESNIYRSSINDDQSLNQQSIKNDFSTNKESILKYPSVNNKSIFDLSTNRKSVLNDLYTKRTSITNQSAVKDISAINQNSVLNDFSITNQSAVKDISAINKKSVLNDFSITNQSAIKNISAINQKSVLNDFSITNQSAIKDISAINQKSVLNDFSITNQSAIKNMSAINQKSVLNDFSITNQSAIKDISAINQKSVKDSLSTNEESIVEHPSMNKASIFEKSVHFQTDNEMKFDNEYNYANGCDFDNECDFDSQYDREGLKQLVESFSQHHDETNDRSIIIVDDSDVYVSCLASYVSLLEESVPKRCIKCSTRIEHLSEFIHAHTKCTCSVDDPIKDNYYEYLRRAHTFEVEGDLENAMKFYLEAVEISDSDVNVLFAIKRLYAKCYLEESSISR